MNQIALLLLVVVAASAAPATGRKTVLSMALDLLPDLQAILASGPGGPEIDPATVTGVTRAFTMFIPIVRQVKERQAKQHGQTEEDVKMLETLDRIERVIPGMINLVKEASSGTPLGVDLEFILPDFTDQIPESARPVIAQDLPNDIATDAAQTYTDPQVPSYTTVVAQELPKDISKDAAQTSTAPQVPIYTAPQAPAQPEYESPVVNFQAPAAVLPFKFDFDAAFKAAKESGTQQYPGASSDGTVHYVLPGGGFFYSSGY